jgi:GNAT superfamily N-acetyltransferase
MELIKAEKSDLKSIKKLYKQAFPKNERKPFFIIKSKRQRGDMEIFKICDGDFAGLAVTAMLDDMVLINYLAVLPEKRGKGIGSETVKTLLEKYSDKRVFLEIETTKNNCEDLENCMRRKRFYLRNGLSELGFSANLFGVEMEILTSGKKLTPEEYREFYIVLFGKSMKKFVKTV